MTIPAPIHVAKLGSDMLRFMRALDILDTPDLVLANLNKALRYAPGLQVMGAAMFPVRWGNWESLEKNKTVFLHPGVPDGWWEEYIELTHKAPGPSIILAQMALAPFTFSEIIKMTEPIGMDRWPVELGLKYGIRDLLNCPVGGRWVVTYWSPKVINIADEARAVLFMGATFATVRLQKIMAPQAARIGRGAALTARELAVLRIISIGRRMREAAKLLNLGEETVRSHLKKAESKLGVHDRTHAVAQAIRQHLIP